MVSKIIREDDVGEIFIAEDFDSKINVYDRLNSDYGYLLKSIKKEKYPLDKNYECLIFKEIVYNCEVVGYSVYDENMLNPEALNLTSFYVLGDYKDYDLVIKDILEMKVYTGEEIHVTNPSLPLVEELLRGGSAIKVDDSLVFSSIVFDVTSDYLETPVDGVDVIPSNVYDLSLGSVLIFDVDGDDIKGYLTKLSGNDPDSCLKSRENVDSEFFEKKYFTILSKDVEIKSFLDSSANDLSDFIDIDSLRSSDVLNDDIKVMLNVEGLSDDDGFKIQKQIVDEYDAGIITDESLLTRITYLCENYGKSASDDEYIPRRGLHEIDFEGKTLYFNPQEGYIRICPECKSEILDFENYCIKCGYNINKDINMSDVMRKLKR